MRVAGGSSSYMINFSEAVRIVGKANVHFLLASVNFKRKCELIRRRPSLFVEVRFDQWSEEKYFLELFLFTTSSGNNFQL